MTKLKHKHGHQFEGHVFWISLIDPFHSASALLCLFVRPSCRDATAGHGWMIVQSFASPDQYGLTAYQLSHVTVEKKNRIC